MADKPESARQGILKWKNGKLGVVYEDQKTGRERWKKVNPQHDLAPDLRDRPDAELAGLEVTFSWPNGGPTDVRSRGAAATPRSPRVAMEHFVNPYTFLPATPRSRKGPLADAAPAGHHRLHDGLWTGTLRVRLRVVTPLLLLDPTRATPHPDGTKDHFVYPVLSRDGRPHLPATGIKGMLRAAYEAVTNSRLGVFQGHTERLAHRMASTDSKLMVPARVHQDGRHIELLPGDTRIGDQARPRPLLHAAWLPRYYRETRRNVTYAGSSGEVPRHGDPVTAVVRMCEYERNNKTVFTFWQVTQISRRDGTGHGKASLAPDPDDSAEQKVIHGWVCSTNRNIGNKHDERVFFPVDKLLVIHELTEDLRRQWHDTITDYRTAHRHADIHHRPDPKHPGRSAMPDAYLGHKPGRTAWSRHLYEQGATKLTPGTLCYAQVDETTKCIRALQPVTIGRSIFHSTPADLLDPSLRPASRLADLSPADRVFGWVAPTGQGAHRGQLRIGPVVPCEDAEFEDFGEKGFPLAILGRPKPQQGRFYVAEDSSGTPLPRGLAKDKWFRLGQALRGRKTYMHHRDLPDDYWSDPTTDRTQQADGSGRFQEYRRPDSRDDGGGGRQLDSQNRSVRGWVRPGSSFTFTIDVTNLSDHELGALVWLLQLPDGHHHRLGLGKPLGFGSVRLTLDPGAPADLRKGAEWSDTYRSLSPLTGAPTSGVRERLDLVRQLFEEAVAVTHRIHEQSPLTTFLKAAQGVEKRAVHYPRVRPENAEGQRVAQDPDGNNYAWFTRNEKNESGGFSLPAIWEDEIGLYYCPPEKSAPDSKHFRRSS